MMRIPSHTQFKNQVDLLNTKSNDLSNTQSRIDSGKNLINSSDNPVLAQSIKSAKDYISLLKSYDKNVLQAQNRTNLAEFSINGCLNEISRAAELIKSAQTDTLNNSDRQHIATELQGILKNIASLANTFDASTGVYIFSGNSTSVVPFSIVGNSYQYMGSTEATYISTSLDTDVIYNESGQNVFGNIKLGNGTFTITQGSTPNTGTAETSAGIVTDISAFVPDTYTLSFSSDGLGNTVYQVTGASTGQVIPVAPASDPIYTPGATISFNGISFQVQGTPNPGDQFVIAPSVNQNALETINQVISVLNQPYYNDVQKASFHQQIGQLSASLGQISTQLTNYLSEIGYRSKQLDTQQTFNTTFLDDQQAILDKYESSDLVDLISEMEKIKTSLLLSQKVYMTLQEYFQQLLTSGI